MTALITGATGFVGRHLLDALSGIGLSRHDADLSRPLPDLPEVQAVIHCAAELNDTSRMHEVNVEGTRRLLRWAESAGVQRFVYLSTGGTSGLYAETKRQAEVLVRQAELDSTVVRLFFPYGPGQRHERLVPRLISRIQQGLPVTIDGSGGPVLSMTFITDVVEAIRRIVRLENGVSTPVDVGGPSVTMTELASTIGSLVQRPPRFEVGNDAVSYIADNDTLTALTGFVPAVSIVTGLRSCVEPGEGTEP